MCPTTGSTAQATPEELKDIIERVNPKRLALIHTEEPELYKKYVSDLGIETITPTRGKILHL